MAAGFESLDSFGTRASLDVGGASHTIYRLDRAAEALGCDLARLPFTLRILLENLLRGEDGTAVSADSIRALGAWQAQAAPADEVAFRPARVLLQDFTGVPAIVDLAAMRDAMADLGGDPSRINPQQPVDLVIDHSVQVDEYGADAAFLLNVTREFERNGERYQFLRWGQQAFEGFRVVPPGTGIVHQVNLEYLAPAVFSADGVAYPDTLVGTDSHTTMINGLGVLGWGVGGIEAEAAMLGQPVSMLIPQVFGVRLTGRLPEGATGTDLVLRVVELLRERNVVGKFVEFFGPGLSALSLAARATIANMCPEYGATVGFFPVDAETLNYLRFTGRPEEQVALVEAYCREQQLFRSDETPDPDYSDLLEIDLGSIEPSLAGPKRPQDRIALHEAQSSSRATIAEEIELGASATPMPVAANGHTYELSNGSVVIAAITSCTNTSNPEVMVAAGLLAMKAVERGLSTPPWVKTSLAPGSRVVTAYLDEAGLTEYLDALGFNLVGYGCTTCIGNSGPLPEAVSQAVDGGPLAVAAVLSGNRNFEARIRQPGPVQLPRLAAARRCLRARRPHGRRPRDAATGYGRRRRAGPPERDLAERAGGYRGHPVLDPLGDVPGALRRRLQWRRAMGRARLRQRPALRLGRRLDLRAPRPLLPGPGSASRRHPWTSRVRASWRSSATPLPRTTSRLRGRSRRTARRGPTCASAKSRAATSTPTARAAATTR